MMRTLKSDWAWWTLHLGSSLLLLTLFFSTLGCDELTLKEKSPEVGQEFPIEKLDSAINDAHGEVSLHTLHVGDRANYEVNYRIETGNPVRANITDQAITQRIDCGATTRLVLTETETTFSGNDQSTVVRAEPIDFAKVDAQPLLPFEFNSQWANKVTPFFKISASARRTLHNLKVAQLDVALPQLAPDCNRFPDCKLPITELKFDIVTWVDEKSPQVDKFLWRISKRVHALANTITLCQSGYVELQGQTYFLNQCQILKDFAYGPENVPDEPGTPESCPKT